MISVEIEEIKRVLNTLILELVECDRITIDQANKLTNRFSGGQRIEGSNDFLLNILNEVE